MKREIITINCRDYSFFHLFLDDYDARETLLQNYEYKVEFCENLDAVIDLTIDGRNVRTLLLREPIKRCDVCIVGRWIGYADIIAEVKQQASRCKQQHPKASFIVVGDASFKNSPPVLKHFELAGQKIFNRKMGDELARDIGAVKYVEYSIESGRSLKIVIDEIVSAYFSKLQDEEDRERMKKEMDEIRRKKTKRYLFTFEKCLEVLHYI